MADDLAPQTPEKEARSILMDAYNSIHMLNLGEPLYSTLDRGLNTLVADFDLHTGGVHADSGDNGPMPPPPPPKQPSN